MTTPIRKHLVTIQGAPPSVQRWVDEFVAAARTGIGDWPHPHDTIPMTLVPYERFLDVVRHLGWDMGTEGPVSGAVPLGPVPRPHSGGVYHEALHSLLGDFH